MSNLTLYSKVYSSRIRVDNNLLNIKSPIAAGRKRVSNKVGCRKPHIYWVKKQPQFPTEGKLTTGIQVIVCSSQISGHIPGYQCQIQIHIQQTRKIRSGFVKWSLLYFEKLSKWDKIYLLSSNLQYSRGTDTQLLTYNYFYNLDNQLYRDKKKRPLPIQRASIMPAYQQNILVGEGFFAES